MSWVFNRVLRLKATGLPCAAIFLLAFASLAAASGVDGRLITANGPVEKGVVKAYRSVDFSGEPAATSSVTGTDGKYSLNLDPGIWYLAAEAPTADNGQLWAWCGQNPVSVSGKERQWIGFILEKWAAPAYTSDEDESGSSYDGTLSGTVLLDGVPGEKVNVTLYFDSTDGFRRMGFLRSPPTGPDGRFQLEMVPEGSYYLIARKRESGEGVGPMVKGDLISYYRHNPIRIVAGKKVEVVLPLTPKKQDRDINLSAGFNGGSGFSGNVTDGQGQPVSGVHVFAYREPEMGHHKPAALSSLTDATGRYIISLPGPGRYYVGARSGYGDNPAPGELFGHYQGTADHSLILEPEQVLEDVNMVVERVLVP